jgi:hypothetical protein
MKQAAKKNHYHIIVTIIIIVVRLLGVGGINPLKPKLI